VIWLFAAACTGPSYDQVSREDTIEGYEQFLIDNPDSAFQNPVEKRLEELYFDKAQKEDTLESWEKYCDRFETKGSPHFPEALKRAAHLAWEKTLAAGTKDALAAYLDKYGKADQVLADRARGYTAALDYGKLEIGEPKIEKVNLGEDPKGPLNGWGVSADVTNAGDVPLAYVRLSVEWLKDDGSELATKDYPLVSDHWNMPATDLQQTPLKPGEKRTWQWTEDFTTLPESATPKGKVFPSGLRPVEAK
jgi:hypothetical protein